MKYIVASPEKVRFLHFNGQFRKVKDVAVEHKARAAINFGFFSMNSQHPVGSYPVGQVMLEGKNLVLSPAGIEHFHSAYKKDGKVSVWQWIPEGSDWGIRAGPRLIESGQICERSISDSAWAAGGIRPTSALPRVAIGIRADSRVVLAYWPGATIRQAAQDMLNLGCVEALAGDGGGSASWYDSKNPGHTVSQRLVPNCFIIEDGSTPGGSDTMARLRVYLSPSNQVHNLGVGDYGTEQSRMHALAWRVGAHLAMAGADVAISRPDQSISEIVITSDTYKPAYHISLHSNAGGGKGVEGFHWPGSVKGQTLTKDIVQALSKLNPGGYRRVEPNSTFGEITGPNAICSYIEVGFHDNPQEVEWIMREAEAIALTIAQVVCRHLGLPIPNPAPDSSQAARQLEVAEAKLTEIRKIVNS